VESDAGKGSLFQVELPVKSSGQSKSDIRKSSKKLAVPSPPGALSIMVVDDSPDTLELFEEMLKSLGHHVRSVDSGYDALKILEYASHPDLIFMDIQMPVLSGTDTMRLVRQRYEGIKIIAQSAHALAGDRDRFLNEGYDAYLPKPFTMDQLSGIISTVFHT